MSELQIPVRRYGRWTPLLRSRFLDALAIDGDVSAAAFLCGLSRQSVYRLRGRDAGFARDWDAAREACRAQGDAAVRALLDEFRTRLGHVRGKGRGKAPLDTVNMINPVSPFG